MSVLLLRFAGPMQAWGSRSRFEYRDTEREPTLSGVIGMIAAAEGKERGADLTTYQQLSMSVRVDREGRLSREFQTAVGVVTASGKISTDAQIIYRDYLADAMFHVALVGPYAVLERVHSALSRPVFPIYLGRKSYVPAVPVTYPGGESLLKNASDALSVLSKLRLAGAEGSLPLRYGNVEDLETVTDTRLVRFVLSSEEPTDEIREDVPLDFRVDRRRYATRYVRTEFHQIPAEPMKERRA